MNKSLVGGWLVVAVVSIGCNCSAPPAVPTLLAEGEKCTGDQMCETGLCDALPETPLVCVRPCSSVCHADEECTQLSPGKFSCAPLKPGICQACRFDTDCPYPADKCIVVDNQNICGRDCAYDQKCPDKYRCMNAVGVDGKAKSQQCAPASGTCQCTLGQGMAEVCNGKDDDCDGTIDNGFDTATDVDHCGACNHQCVLDHATPKCQASACKVASCTMPFANCDHADENGCETDTTTVTNCGSCGNACTFANATPRCEANACKFTCLPGFIDLDGVATNGCEYQCTPTSTTDLPDLGFVDANCDGIDGEWDKGIFVAPAAGGGSNSNVGDRLHPMATINAAVAAAIAQNKRDVYVASGTYPGAVTLTGVHGLTVAGGYSVSDWRRSLNNTTTVGPANPALAIDTNDHTTVQFITVQGANASLPGATAYGASVKNSTLVTLEGLTLSAGAGADGVNGLSAAPAVDGVVGQPGNPGVTHDPELSQYFLCTTASAPLAGSGGGSTCGRAGGTGGAPGWAGALVTAGSSGADAGTSRGGLGTPDHSGDWSGAVPAQYNGQDGVAGLDGPNGQGASGSGTLTASGYVAALAQAGGIGTAGTAGGGGGGGGGGCSKSLADVFCVCFSYGSGGGGGGSAGCAGGPGLAGQAGGASIGLWSWSSTVTVRSTTITTANAGNGGNGGDGAAGGIGAAGAASNYDGNAQGDASKGGKGGRGGNGGKGGHGGGGMGGSNLGIAANTASTVSTTGVSFQRGQPGIGGMSKGLGGQNGPSSDVQLFP